MYGVTVPLVIYVEGERKILGQSTINNDGSVTMHLDDSDISRDFLGLIRIDKGEFSIGQVAGGTYNPPPKIQ